jgi:hypothetical protein
MKFPTIFAHCWGWLTDGKDCKVRKDGSTCYACAAHFEIDPS